MWLLRCGCHGDRKLRNHRICPKAPRTLSCIMVEMYLNRSWNFTIFVFGAAYVGCEASDEGFWNLACYRNWCSNLALHFCWADACSAFWTLHASLLSQLLYEEKKCSLWETRIWCFGFLSFLRRVIALVRVVATLCNLAKVRRELLVLSDFIRRSKAKSCRSDAVRALEFTRSR